MAHDHRMNPVEGPYLNRKIRESFQEQQKRFEPYLNGIVGPSAGDEGFPNGEAYQHALKHMPFSAMPGPGQMKKSGFSSVGPVGRSKYMTDLRNITQEIGLDPDNTEHLGSVHRIYAIHLSAQDKHFLTGNAGLPRTTFTDLASDSAHDPSLRPNYDFSKRREAPQKFED